MITAEEAHAMVEEARSSIRGSTIYVVIMRKIEDAVKIAAETGAEECSVTIDDYGFIGPSDVLRETIKRDLAETGGFVVNYYYKHGFLAIKLLAIVVNISWKHRSRTIPGPWSPSPTGARLGAH